MEHQPRAPRIRRHHFARAIHDGRSLDLLVADFSRSGMRIVEPVVDFPEGDTLVLEITGDAFPAIQVTGTVARLTGDGFAVRFDVSDEDRARWLEYLRDLSRVDR